MTGKPIEFWYEFASPYSYLAAFQIEQAAAAAHLAVIWRPFLLGPIFAQQGWTDSPFNLYPVKGAYMLRDIERLCLDANLPWRNPSTFPRNGLLAARIALNLPEPNHIAAFSKAVFSANFADDQDISSPELLRQILTTLALPAEDLVEKARSDASKAALRRQTDQAITLGIFGAPSFVIGKELFWGNDRLEQAIRWAKKETASLNTEAGRF